MLSWFVSKTADSTAVEPEVSVSRYERLARAAAVKAANMGNFFIAGLPKKKDDNSRVHHKIHICLQNS